MYDKEKGIYPQGQYLTGRDLPIGGYLLKNHEGKMGEFIVYDSYDDFKNEEESRWETFDEEYHISIMKENEYISIQNADIYRL